MHHPPPTTPHPCPWRHYTGNVRDKRADSCSPVSRRLVCSACLEASQGRSELKVEFVGFLGNTSRTWHGWWPRNKIGEEGSVGGGEQLLQLTSGWRSYPAGCFDWFSSGSGSGFWMRTWIFQSVHHQLHHFVQASQETNFSHFCFLFSLGGFFVCFSWLALGRC